MFSEDLKRVALVEKDRPDFLAGFYNGIGGKAENDIDSSDSPLFLKNAMVREFEEECGIKTAVDEWDFITLINRFKSPSIKVPYYSSNCTWQINVFTAIGDISKCRTVESETIHIVDFDTCHTLPLSDLAEWCLPLSRSYWKFRERKMNLRPQTNMLLADF